MDHISRRLEKLESSATVLRRGFAIEMPDGYDECEVIARLVPDRQARDLVVVLRTLSDKGEQLTAAPTACRHSGPSTTLPRLPATNIMISDCVA